MQENGRSNWSVMTPDGRIEPTENFNLVGNNDLKDFISYEKSGSREQKEAPAHIKMMQQLELVDYEPASDSGNFRWLPKGHLIKSLMERHASELVKNYGAMQVETPIMYDINDPKLASYLKRFPARQYRLQAEEGSKEYFLRFAACFGQYMIMKDMGISYQHLPLNLYELTHYSFRKEQGGELAGLRRLRSFTMPDMHTLCADMEQAKEEFYKQYLLSKKWMSDLGLDHVMALRVVDDFFKNNRDLISEISKDFDKPILLELWKERFFYFVLKFEFNVVDEQRKAAALSTVQIDVENCKRFDINYIDKNGQQQNPLLLHASISGSIDRNLYALLEQQAKRKNREELVSLPYWLCPTQVRLIPMSERHLSKCIEIVSRMRGIRVEIDDRNESLSKKIRGSETNWVPFTIVIGDKEINEEILTVRERGIREQKSMNEIDFFRKLKGLQGNMPFEPLNWPLLVSRQPHFH